jgi:DNA-binding transcriptional MerR regulator
VEATRERQISERETEGPDYRIDELARVAGTTVRNVRSYQDRGLLPSPRRVGRVAWYSDAHVARLRLVGQLLERGYTLANIRELVSAWESGQDVGELLGLEAALAEPWSDETPVTMTAAELAEALGEGVVDPDRIDQALELGILEATSDAFVVHKPRMLRVGAELVSAGIPLAAVLDLGQQLRADVDRIATAFVELVGTHVFGPVGEPIPADQVPRLTEIVRRLRPLAKEAVDAELADAMERHVVMELRDRLGRILAGYQPRHEAS